MLEILLTILYVIVCLFLILVVLLQSGKAGDLASAFGGQSSQTAFGSRGTADLLSKATTFSAVGFLVLALALAVLSARKSSSVLERVAPPQEAPAAAAPVEEAASEEEGIVLETPVEEAAPLSTESESPADELPASE
jgi:preprotein translocase subunit SecG